MTESENNVVFFKLPNKSQSGEISFSEHIKRSEIKRRKLQSRKAILFQYRGAGEKGAGSKETWAL